MLSYIVININITTLTLWRFVFDHNHGSSFIFIDLREVTVTHIKTTLHTKPIFLRNLGERDWQTIQVPSIIAAITQQHLPMISEVNVQTRT
jgi:hypothetical protein